MNNFFYGSHLPSLSEEHAPLNQMYVAICMYLSFMQMSRVMNLEVGLSSILQARFFFLLKEKAKDVVKNTSAQVKKKEKEHYLEPNIE